MKFTTTKEELARTTNLLSRLATTRATLPILQNILLEVQDNTLTIRATDLEQTLEAVINGEGFEDGIITISARLLYDYLQNNSDEKITLSSSDITLKIDSTNHHAQIKGMAAEDFPRLPKATFPHEVVIKSDILNQILSKIIFAATTDETRQILTGLLFRFQGDRLQIVATDGYRLVYHSITINQSITGDYIIPKKSLLEIQRLLNQADEVIFSMSSNQLQVKVGNLIFTSRILEGVYPPFESRIPEKYTTSITLSASSFIQALKLASLFSRDSAFSTKLELVKNTLKVTAVSPVLGENSNDITVKVEQGSDFSISVNAQYFIDALATISGDIQLHFIDSKSPVVLTLSTQKDYLYLVMPLRSE